MPRPRLDPRHVTHAELTGSASRLAGRRGADLTHNQKLAELLAISDDPDVLAEAAAYFVPAGRKPYLHETTARQLLVDAGADEAVIQRYGDARRALPRGRAPRTPAARP